MCHAVPLVRLMMPQWAGDTSTRDAYLATQVSERDAAEAARKAERQSAADRIYDKLRLEKEAQLRAQVGTRIQHQPHARGELPAGSKGFI